ncbi:MAG: hypothetical protein RL357_1766 [Pseudomonadota bacterium]
MLFHSSIRKELGRSFWASWVVLFTIAMTVRLVRTLHDANVGRVDPQAITVAMGYAALGQMPAIITIALFIATVSVLSRMYRDSEMDIWLGSGQGLARLVTPLYQFAVPLLLAIAALQWWVWPWTNQQIQDLRQRYEQRADIDRVTPGQFQESGDGKKVFFVDKNVEASGVARSLFYLDRSSGSDVVITSRSSKSNKSEGNDSEQASVTLIDGERVQRLPEGEGFRVIQFGELTIAMDNPSAQLQGAGARAMPTLELIQSNAAWAKGELAWRAGMVLLAANLVMIALAIAQVNPRLGSGASIATAALTAIVYFNLTTVSQSWVSSGKVSLLGATLGLHGGILLLSALWLAKRHHQWHWRHLVSASASARSAA